MKYQVTLTIHNASGDKVTYTRSIRAVTETSAKWQVLRLWGSQTNALAVDLARIELEVKVKAA